MKIPKAFTLVAFVIVIVALLYCFYLKFGDDIKRQKRLNDLLVEKLEENARLQQELDETREKLAKLQNPEYLEYMAREFGLGYEDEVVYIYTDSNKNKNPKDK